MADQPEQIDMLDDDAIVARVKELDSLSLRGGEVIREFSKLLEEWDPRIVAEAIRSNPKVRPWLNVKVQNKVHQHKHEG